MKSQCLLLGAFASSVSFLGCSPAPDPVGKAAVHFQVRYPSDPDVTGTCDNPGIGGIGDPPPSLPSGLDVSSFGEVVADGQSIEGTNGNYIVKCTVTDGGKIEVDIEGPNDSPQSGATMGTITRMTVSGSIGDSGSGTGQVTVGIPDTGPNSPRAGYACELNAVADPNDPGEFLLKEGEATFTFFCPRTESTLSDFGTCETVGTVVLKSCLEG